MAPPIVTDAGGGYKSQPPMDMTVRRMPGVGAGAPGSNGAVMDRSGKSLAEVRKRIDSIDDRLHDLLMERAALVRSVDEAKAKTGAPSAAILADSSGS